MARFDVYAPRDQDHLLLDVQADYLCGLDTRLIVPLRRPEAAPMPARRLNPVFDIGGETYVMTTQYSAAVRVRDLGRRVSSLAAEADAVRDALDMLLVGF
jgi:toxin CcdB